MTQATASGQRLQDLLEALRSRKRAPAVMGVLNVTPDSFSDGQCFRAPESAVAHALTMINQGADIIDIGPESTRPGADPVPAAEQMDRAIPVIRALRQAQVEVPLSIDTQNAQVAAAAVEAGADMVNDVSALRGDPEMADRVAEWGVPVVLMHMRGTPRTMQTAGGGPVYEDVVAEVRGFLSERIEFAAARGIDRGRIVVDPGLGFGKRAVHNLNLLRRLREVADLDAMLLVGASRKSFIGQATGVAGPADRLAGSLACAVAAVLGGAAILRVHDVGPTREAVQMAWGVLQS